MPATAPMAPIAWRRSTASWPDPGFNPCATPCNATPDAAIQIISDQLTQIGAEMYKSVCLLPLICALHTNGVSQEVHPPQPIGHTLTISGKIDNNNYPSIVNAIDDPAIDRVEFRDCEGGTKGAEEAIGSAIARRNLPVIASGTVGSACAGAFLYSPSRSVVDRADTASKIVIHGYRLQEGPPTVTQEQSLKVANLELAKFIHKQTGGKTPINIAIYITSITDGDDGAWFYSHPIEMDGKLSSVVICDKHRLIQNQRCAAISGVNMSSFGIITN